MVERREDGGKGRTLDSSSCSFARDEMSCRSESQSIDSNCWFSVGCSWSSSFMVVAPFAVFWDMALSEWMLGIEVQIGASGGWMSGLGVE